MTTNLRALDPQIFVYDMNIYIFNLKIQAKTYAEVCIGAMFIHFKEPTDQLSTNP